MDNGKENGNYCNGLYRGHIGIPLLTTNKNPGFARRASILYWHGASQKQAGSTFSGVGIFVVTVIVKGFRVHS